MLTSEAAAEFRTSLVYDPDHVPTMGNYGVTLGRLGRRTEALQIFERIIDTSSDPAELQSSYANLEDIYKDWGKADLATIYRQKVAALEAAAAERRAQYADRGSPKDKIAALANAMMYAEIKSDDQNE